MVDNREMVIAGDGLLEQNMHQRTCYPYSWQMEMAEDGQPVVTVVGDRLLEQSMHLEIDRNLRRRNEPPLLPRDCLLQTGGGPGS